MDESDSRNDRREFPPTCGEGYEVGYKKPPENTRFRRGQSGNPRGRPRGSKSWKTLVEEELNKKICVID